MKKYFGCLIIIAAMICMFSNVSFAAGKVVESPTVKTFISGKQVKFSSASISVNGEVLLNSKELLVKLGIPNDSKHIILDKSKKNLTIVSGKTKIIMTVNSNKAKVNNASKGLNSAPVLYKNQYYIPVKSTALLLGKKFAWDAVEKSIYIQNLNDYNKVKALLDKAVKTTAAVDKYIVETTSDSNSMISDEPLISSVKTVCKIDRKKVQMALNIKIDDSISGSSTGFYYLYNNYLYTKYSFQDTWDKELLTKEDCEDQMMQFDIGSFEISDILYCGMTIEEKPKDNLISLKGNVYLKEKGGKYDIEPVSTYLEISINKSNNLITRISHKHSEYQNSSSSKDSYLNTSTESYTYRDINGNFVIETPDESKMVFEAPEADDGASEQITLSRDEQTKVDGLKAKVDKVSVDGAWASPYDISASEALMFIIIKNQTDFDTYTGLSDDAKVVFMNDIIQDNFGDYLGCEAVYGFTVFENKAYSCITTGYEIDAGSLELEDYSGAPEEIDIVKQDKENNTYEDY